MAFPIPSGFTTKILYAFLIPLMDAIRTTHRIWSHTHTHTRNWTFTSPGSGTVPLGEYWPTFRRIPVPLSWGSSMELLTRRHGVTSHTAVSISRVANPYISHIPVTSTLLDQSPPTRISKRNTAFKFPFDVNHVRFNVTMKNSEMPGFSCWCCAKFAAETPVRADILPHLLLFNTPRSTGS